MNRTARRVPVARDAWIPAGTLVVLALLAAWLGYGWIAAIAILAAIAVFGFFRDPDRDQPATGDFVVAPADGRIVALQPATDDQGAGIGIFLSIFDVHINRVPVSGEVTAVERTRGGFRAAFRDDVSQANERVAMTIRTASGAEVVCTQIAGAVARRIVCRARVGESVTAGQRYGLIRFGSRVDVALPAGTRLLVEKGDRTRGGVTPLARLRGSSGP